MLASLQWLTTPREGYTAARKTARIAQNDSLISPPRDDFQNPTYFHKGEGFFRPFVLRARRPIFHLAGTSLVPTASDSARK